ncbi:hypothetical protein KV097_16545 [Mumia sp. zg.B17]|uniref:hypothetical protein n=1 Tax=Mumia sp. zg.B17 TaxID=2855446 RepID=UPI001C6EBB3A|nr:hypothetical protein [Mumia sp. zg.B17]MBW9207549.1 hypothetical protein [Mumia sp. zg.B17]
MSDEPIRGKVAAIINRRELALNVGEDDGVAVGMRFAILNSKGVGITDPDTGAPLGDIPVIKTVVKVTRVDGPKLATARTFRTVPGKPGVAEALLRSSSNWAGTPTRVETLSIDPSRADVVEIEDEDSFIKRGDTAVQTFGDEYDDYA